MLVTPAMGISPRWKRGRIAIYGSTRFLSGFDRSRIAEEVLSYIDKLRWVIEKIPAHKSVLVFSLVDLCPFQWAGSEWEVQESIETYNKYLRSLASERSNVRYVDLPDFTRRYSSSQLFDWRFYFISQMGINPKLASDFSCWFEDRLREISPLPEEVSGIGSGQYALGGSPRGGRYRWNKDRR